VAARNSEGAAAGPLLDDYRVSSEPFYRPVGNEISLYQAAYAHRMPLILKGPTGCGKTRFVEHMAWSLGRPLVTLACNEDMTASDLVGRYLLDANGTAWHDGPLTLAVRYGAICYLDEVVEARQDTTVVIHPLTDARRILPLDKKGEVLHAHPDFQLVVSYNPGYQSSAKDMKPSTRQRFAALEFDYPDAALETEIVAHEAGIPSELARTLVGIGQRSRALWRRAIARYWVSCGSSAAICSSRSSWRASMSSVVSVETSSGSAVAMSPESTSSFQ